LSQAEFVEIEQTEAKQRNTAIGMDQIREYASRVAEDASNDIDASIGVWDSSATPPSALPSTRKNMTFDTLSSLPGTGHQPGKSSSEVSRKTPLERTVSSCS